MHATLTRPTQHPDLNDEPPTVTFLAADSHRYDTDEDPDRPLTGHISGYRHGLVEVEVDGHTHLVPERYLTVTA